jgi:hypothetical protein
MEAWRVVSVTKSKPISAYPPKLSAPVVASTLAAGAPTAPLKLQSRLGKEIT